MPRHRFPNTRERIEKAAIRLFVEKGVAETSVRDIARAVDISEGALYRHFVSKDELVWQVFERQYVQFTGRLESLAHPEVTARGKLAAMALRRSTDTALFLLGGTALLLLFIGIRNSWDTVTYIVIEHRPRPEAKQESASAEEPIPPTE